MHSSVSGYVSLLNEEMNNFGRIKNVWVIYLHLTDGEIKTGTQGCNMTSQRHIICIKPVLEYRFSES